MHALQSLVDFAFCTLWIPRYSKEISVAKGMSGSTPHFQEDAQSEKNAVAPVH
jgi:hypothetical protein